MNGSAISKTETRMNVLRAHPNITATLLYIHHLGYVCADDLVSVAPRLYGSSRTAARHLAQLRSLRFAAPSPRSTRFEPLFFHTTHHGRTFLKDHQCVFSIPETRHETISSRLLNHERDVTRLVTAALRWVAVRPDVTLKDLQRNFHRPTNQLPYLDPGHNGKEKRYKPDASLLVHRYTDRIHLPLQTFFEMEEGTNDMPKIRWKIERFHRWFTHVGRHDLTKLYKQISGLNNPAPWYQVAFVARSRNGDDSRHLIKILRAAGDVKPRPVVFGTTFDRVEASLSNGEQRIWVTPEDISELDGEVQEMAEQLHRIEARQLWPSGTDA